MGMFDDLIPGGNAVSGEPSSSAAYTGTKDQSRIGMFDDLIPKTGRSADPPDTPIAQRKIINGKEYKLGKESGAVFDENNKIVDDPSIRQAFGLKDAPTISDYEGEFGRSVVRGGAGLVASTVRGIAENTSDNAPEIQRVEQGIANFANLNQKDRQALYDSLPQRLSPVVAFNYQLAIRHLARGDAEGAKSYLDTARKYTDTTPVDQQPLYQAGQSIDQNTAKAFPEDPRFRGSWTTGIGSGLGSLVPLIPISMLTGGTGVFAVAGPASSDQSYQQAKQSIAGNDVDENGNRIQYRDDRGGFYNSGLGAEAETKALQAARLGALPGLSENIPIESFIEQAPKLIPGLRPYANTPAWKKFAKAFGRVGVQMFTEGGQEGFQQWAANVINKITTDPSQLEDEGVWQNTLIGGIVGGGTQVGAEAIGSVAGSNENQINVSPPPPGTPPAGTPPTDRVEPRLFPDQQPASGPTSAGPGSPGAPPPAGPQPTPTNPTVTAAPADAYLSADGYSPEQIADMTADEKKAAVESAVARGVVPARPAPPAPGAAPMAPRASAGPAQAAPEAPRHPPGPAVWANADHDQPVTILDEPPQQDQQSGQWFQKVAINDGTGYLPFDELQPQARTAPAPGTSPRAPRAAKPQPAPAAEGTFGDMLQSQGSEYRVGPISFGFNERNGGRYLRVRDHSGQNLLQHMDGADPSVDVTDIWSSEDPNQHEHRQGNKVGINSLENNVPSQFLPVFHDWLTGKIDQNEALARIKATPRSTTDQPQKPVDPGMGLISPEAGSPQEAAPVAPAPTIPENNLGVTNGEISPEISTTSEEQGGDTPVSPAGQPTESPAAPPTVHPDKLLSDYIGGKKPLTPEAYAKHAGLTKKAAGKELQRAALAGWITQGRNGKWRRNAVRTAPLDALAFLASKGGVSDPTGELAGMDLPKMTVHGPVVRKTGMHPDKAREALVEAGYMRDAGRDSGGQATSTVADFYDVMARAAGGEKVYSVEDQAKGDEIATTKAAELQNPDLENVHPVEQRWGSDVWAKVQQSLADQGLSEENWSPQEISDVARLVAGGMDADSAFERAALTHVDETADDLSGMDPALDEAFQTNDPNATVAFEPPPFDAETTQNDIQQQAPYEAGNGIPAPGEESVGGSGAAETDRTGPEVRGAGEAGAKTRDQGTNAGQGTVYDRLKAWLDSGDTSYTILQDLGVEAFSALQRLASDEQSYDNLNGISALTRRLADKLYQHGPAGKTKKAIAEREKAESFNDRLDQLRDSIKAVVTEKQDQQLKAALKERGFSDGDYVRYTGELIDTRTGEDFEGSHASELSVAYGRVEMLINGGMLFLDPEDIRTRLEPADRATEEARPKSRVRRNAINSNALEDDLSPAARDALAEYFKRRNASRDLRYIREAMEVYTRAVDSGLEAEAKDVLDAAETFFTDQTERNAMDLQTATYRGLQAITGEEDPDPNQELLENEVYASAQDAGELIFQTLDPKTASFDVEEFNTAYGDVELRRPVENVFPAVKEQVRVWKEVGLDRISQVEAKKRIQSWKDFAKRVGEEENHSDEVIISLFDHTGQWSQPYRDAGYTVLQYDIKNGNDLMKFGDWMGDVENQINEGKGIVGILAAPPCTTYASSGARWWQDVHDKADQRMIEKTFGKVWAAEFFKTPVEYANALVAVVKLIVEQADPTFYAMENPVGRIQSQNQLPDARLSFDPANFGNPYTKRTLLWGDFNTNLPTANVEPTLGSLIHKLRGDNPEQKAQRSETPEGFAYAFFMANNTSELKFGEYLRKIAEPAPAVAPTTEKGADNREQIVIPGAEQDQKGALDNAAKAPLKAKADQKGMDIGLFGSERDQTDMFDQPKPNSASAKPNSANAETTPAKIEDFGEKILGARKDAVRNIVDSLTGELDLETATVSQAFPAPNYVEMAKAGVDKKALALVALMRESIPSKPRKKWKLNDWASKLNIMREFSRKLLNNDVTAENVIKLMDEKFPTLRKLTRMADVLEKLPPELMPFGAKFSIKGGTYHVWNGIRHNPPVTMYVLEDENGRQTNLSSKDVTEVQQNAVAVIQTKANKNAEEKTGKSRLTPLHVYRDRKTGKAFIGFEGLGRQVIRLKADFEKTDDARAYIKDNAEELQKLVDEMREGPAWRRAANMPRVGEPRREGDVSPEQFSAVFGFRGVQFGNYVEGDRRQSDLNEAFDALMDMADVLGIPPLSLSLNGELGLAFGARGHGGKNAALAHYEPGQVVINLTKNSGAGSLAHEWLHAVDHYFARQNTGKPGRAYISEARNRLDVREKVWDAWKGIEKSIDKGPFNARALELDKAKSKPYWSTTIEKAARAFERYIVARLEAKGASNDYLANLDLNAPQYPTKEELEGGIGKAYDDLFAALDVRWSEDKKKAALFSAPRAPANRQSSIPANAAATAGYSDTGKMMAHSGYRAAKAGDSAAAISLVSDLVPAAMITHVRDNYGPSHIFVPVSAIEQSGKNAIPGVLARYLAQIAGADVKTDILQSSKAKHTQANPIERLLRRPTFSGPVQPGGRYVLVDDVTVMGGTLAELANHIQQNGGEVAGVVTLVNTSRNGLKGLAPATKEQVRDVERRFGNEVRSAFGVEPSALTFDEAQYLRNFRDADALGTRISAAGGTIDGRSGQEGVSERSPRDEGPQGRLSSAPRPIFYSGLLRAVEGMKQEKAPMTQWMGMIRNAPGVKPEELQWVGLDDWLARQDGAITKQQVVDFIRANQVQVKEVLHEAKKVGGYRSSTDYRNRLWEMTEQELADEYVSEFGIDPHEALNMAIDETSTVMDELAARYEGTLANRGANSEGAYVADDTKYKSYQLPGGENYRELLLTLPEATRNDIVSEREIEAGNKIADFNRRMREKYGEMWSQRLSGAEQDEQYYLEQAAEDAEIGFTPYTELPQGWHSIEDMNAPAHSRWGVIPAGQTHARFYQDQAMPTEAEAIQRALDYYNSIERSKARTAHLRKINQNPNYISGHWTEPNIVAHIRFNERMVDGKRVLFVEEIQSDWHQTGRKQGYRRTPEQIATLRAAAQDVVDRKIQPKAQFVRSRILSDDGSVDVRQIATSDIVLWEKNGIISNDEAMALDAYNQAVDNNGNTVPNAPFKTTWPELAMKRVIRWAAENGFDRVAWTPGQVQADRYDLSKHIDAIAYQKRGDSYGLEIRQKGAFENTRIGEHTAQQLEAQVGKELAEKIINGEGKTVGFYGADKGWKVLDGLDLKIGGEGMKGFYDKMLVDVANKLGKKFGSRVKQIELRGKDYDVVNRNAAEAYGEGSDAHRQALANQTTVVPSFDITPEMRAAAMQGQPLFKKKTVAKPAPMAPKVGVGIIEKPKLGQNPYQFVLSKNQRLQLIEEVKKLAPRLLGHHIVEVVLYDEMPAGMNPHFDPNTGIIHLALKCHDDPRLTLRHEAIHLLRQVGVFTPHEWAILSRQARSRWIEQYDIRARYEQMYRESMDITGDQLEELMIEEAIADAFAEHWISGKGGDDVISRIFYKIKQFLEAVANLARGHGFKTAGGIMSAAESGEIAQRQRGSGQDRGFVMYAKQQSAPRSITAKTMVELRAKIYEAEGWTREVGESQAERIKSAYDVKFDQKNNRITATKKQAPLFNVPPDDGGRGPIFANPSPTIDPEIAAIEEFAGNINLNYIDGPESLKALLQETADMADGFMVARRGVVSHDQTRLLADELGMTPEKLLKRKKGEAWNAHNIFAARVMLLKSAQLVKQAAARVQKTKSDIDRAYFMRLMTRHAAIQEQVAGLAAEAGRALNQYRMMSGADYLKSVTEALNERSINGKIANNGVDDLADMIGKMNQPGQVATLSRSLFKRTFLGMIREYYINSLLSGPSTQTVNFMSNLLVAANQIPENFLAEQIGRLHGGDKVQKGETVARAIGLLEGSREGLQLAWQTLKTGEQHTSETQLEQGTQKAIPGVIGEVVRIPSRLMMSADDLFKAVNYRAELNALAVRKAMATGATGQNLARLIQDLRSDPTEEMVAQAHEAARYQTFQNKLGPTGQAIMRFREATNLWPILPFLRTPINVLKYATERTPLGPLLMKEARDNLTGKNGGAARDLQISRMVLGTIVMTGMAAMVLSGMATGGGSDDEKEKKVQRANGWQPYSLFFGGKYYSYLRFDPFALHLGIMADLIEMKDLAKKGDYEKIAWAGLASVINNIVSKTWLKSATEFSQMTTNPKQYVGQYAATLASGFVPNLLAQAARTMDPAYRDAQTILDTLKGRIPGLKETLPQRYDLFGEPITSEGNFGPDIVSPVWMSTQKDNPVAKALLDAGYFPGMPRRHINGHDLTGEQYAEYTELAGKEAMRRLSRIVQAESWAKRSQDNQERALKKGFDQARELARSKIMAKYPELRKKAVQ